MVLPLKQTTKCNDCVKQMILSLRAIVPICKSNRKSTISSGAD